MTDLIKFFQGVGRLKKTIRTGWQVAGIKNPESVADHSWRLATLCMVLGDKFGIDTNKLIRMALVDDLAEAITGDVIYARGEKVLGDHDEKLEKERKAIKEIFSKLENGHEYLALWEEGQKGESRESQILKQLDKLEMAMQALEYEYEGEVESEKLDEFWINVKKHLKDPKLIEVFNNLEEQRALKLKG